MTELKILWTSSEVTVWHASLKQDPDLIEPVLSAADRERSLSYSDPKLRRRFIVRRGLLRGLLAERLDCWPGSVELEYDARGKLHVAGDLVQISVASSREKALFAISSTRPVGVDIEMAEFEFPFKVMLKDYFSGRERDWLSALPEAERFLRFFQAWTRKEACAKALGEGLAYPFTTLEVTGDLGPPPGLEVTSLPQPELFYFAAVAVSSRHDRDGHENHGRDAHATPD